MLTLIENGEVYAPRRLGRRTLLLVDGRIGLVGEVDRAAVRALGLDHEIIEADDCVVTPGLIDPHEHLLGGSGESGFPPRPPRSSSASSSWPASPGSWAASAWTPR